MKSIKFEEVNIVLKAGNNPNTNDLEAARALDPQTNMPFIISKWQLDEEEMKRFLETGEFFICIMGNTHPPILPTIYDPFKEHGFTIPKGLPTMKYREDVEKTLREIYYRPDWFPTIEDWEEWEAEVARIFDFQAFGERIDIAVKNNVSIDEVMDEFKRHITKIMLIDELEKSRTAN